MASKSSGYLPMITISVTFICFYPYGYIDHKIKKYGYRVVRYVNHLLEYGYRVHCNQSLSVLGIRTSTDTEASEIKSTDIELYAK